MKVACILQEDQRRRREYPEKIDNSAARNWLRGKNEINRSATKQHRSADLSQGVVYENPLGSIHKKAAGREIGMDAGDRFPGSLVVMWASSQFLAVSQRFSRIYSESESHPIERCPSIPP